MASPLSDSGLASAVQHSQGHWKETHIRHSHRRTSAPIPIEGPTDTIHVFSNESEARDEAVVDDRIADRMDRMQALSLMAGGVAHRFNNLLTAIQGNVCSVYGQLQDESLREELADAIDACHDAAEFTSHLLAISGRHWAENRVMDVRDLIAGLDLGRLVRGRTVFCLDLSTDPCRAEVDPSHVEQVAVNLVRNAAAAVEDGGVVHISVDRLPATNVEGAPGPGWVQIEVSDNGPGMGPETAARAFDPFFTTRPTPDDAGLGLPVAYGLARRMGGSISLSSEPGSGTRARVWIPAATGAVSGPRPVE